MATHPNNAAFVSKDGLASFDEYGRKLDSNGNVAWGDHQSLRGAGATPRQEYWDRKFQEEMAAMQQAPAVEAAPSQWRETVAPGPVAVGGVATAPGQSNRQGQPAAAGAMRGFPNSPAPQLPPGLAPVTAQAAPRYDPLSSAPVQGTMRGFPNSPAPVTATPQAAPRYDPLSSAPAMQYVQGLNLPMPNNEVFDPYTPPPVQGTTGMTPTPTPATPAAPAMRAPAPRTGTPTPPQTPTIATGTPAPTAGLPPAMEYLQALDLPFAATPAAPPAQPSPTPARPTATGTPAAPPAQPTPTVPPVAAPEPQLAGMGGGMWLDMWLTDRLNEWFGLTPQPGGGGGGGGGFGGGGGDAENPNPQNNYIVRPMPNPQNNYIVRPMPNPQNMPTRTTNPQNMPTWTPYQPYGVTAGLPGVSVEDEESINQAVLWR